MRAPGIAVIVLGSVIALSATLGMSYRSDASPLGDPSSSVTDSSTPVATDSSSAPASTQQATDGQTSPAAADTSSSAASNPPAVTDDPTPSDSAAPPAPPTDGQGIFHPFFAAFASVTAPLPPIATYSFPSIRSIAPTVTLTDGADGLTFTYQHFDTDGSPIDAAPRTSFSTDSAFTGPQAYGPTSVDGPGLWQFTVTESWSDDSFDPTSTSTYFYVPDAPDLTGMHSIGDNIYEFNGYGTTDDQVEVVSGAPGGFTVVCGPVTVSYYGWYCDTDGAPDLNATYWAIQIDTGSDCNGSELGCDLSPYDGGALSPASSSITYYPSVSFEPRPAGAHLVANPGLGSYGTNVDYSMWQTFAGEGGPYSDWGGYAGQPSCDAGEGTIPGTNTCDASGLAPGYYQYDVWQDSTNGEVDHYFTVPSTPTLSVTPSGSGRAVLSGTVADDVVNTVGDPVHVLVDGSSPTCDGSTVAANGTWSCIITGLKGGSHTFQTFVEDANTGSADIESPDHVTGGLSAGSSIVSAKIHVTSTTTPTDSPTPFPDWFFTVTGVDLNNVHPGDTFTVTGSGLPPGSTVSGELHSKAVSIGSAVVQPDGSFSLPVTVPADFPAGAHTLVMTLTPPGSTAVDSQQPLKVVAASDSSGAGDSPSPSDSPSPLGSSEGPGIDHHGPNSNILTHGLNSIADVVAHPAKVPAAIEIGLVLLIFAVLPGHLLNATLAEQYERFTKRREQRRRAPGRWARLVAFLHRAPFVAGLALTTATALLFGFADPRFGFSLASLRLFLGLAIALAIVSYLTNAVVGRIMRGRWNVDVQVSLRPLGLILTVVGVVVSRLLDFSPGFLIGLVLGLVISEKHLAKQAWRAVLLRSSILLGLALLAWFAFSLFDSKQEGGSFASELAIETLVAITTEAVVGLLVELLPLKLLEGEKLYEKSKVLWGALYLLAVFIFVVAVVPWEGNWAELGSSLWTWIGIVVGFGIVATGIYLYFRIRGHEEHEAHRITDADANERVPIASEDE